MTEGGFVGLSISGAAKMPQPEANVLEEFMYVVNQAACPGATVCKITSEVTMKLPS